MRFPFPCEAPMMTRMPRKPKPQPDNPEQSKRFIDAAKKAGVDQSGETFNQAFRRVTGPKPDAAKDR